ncbi:hypothetical protein MSG28_006923 [Choristoneura fumiferana]|uniref:Uncharacterized protein n=1 Tax=Choristoneura fumiferana TaxID=7141 RepID=A0ACC0JLM1_CHOFU|nr:hypothetical protein MSG28_006923 [Choristoneura fumiferana]
MDVCPYLEKAEPPEFRILAPEFVCPKDAEATLVKPDSIIITAVVAFAGAGAAIHAAAVAGHASARKEAERTPARAFVYAIKNDELLPGVNYIFNVTASTAEGEHTLKSFHINNVQGDHNLERIEGHADLLSVVLVGGQETYADVEFAMEALVTTCYPTQDYYFDWTIQSTETDDKVDTALTSSRLEIPANSLRAGLTYLVTCQVIRESNGDYITQISPLPRVLNEGTKTVVVANVSNVTPLCSLTWYFAGEEFLQSQNQVVNDSCDDCQHGEPLTETLTIYSLEENFLDELTDFSNETEWRQVTAEMPAAQGRARFVAECACRFMFACDSQGTVYAEMLFELNRIPKANDVMVTPESGSALETIFRVSTLAALDPNSPLYYTFYCQVGVNYTLALGSYTEHMAVETILPYVVDGTEVWVEVCDVLGACARSASKVVPLSPGDGATIAVLLEDTHAHIRRCELEQLQRIAVAAVTTYKNAGQPEVFEQFCTNLLTALPMAPDCLRRKSEKYLAFLIQLVEIGCDATAIVNGFELELTEI